MSMMNMMIMMIRMMRMDFDAIGVETQRLFNSTLTRKTSMIETKGDTETALWQHSSFGVLSPAVICSVVIQQCHNVRLIKTTCLVQDQNNAQGPRTGICHLLICS